mmetsp:Transcript_101699/g.286733  ORF Transcript_101699/g.286733 Transcript_101699/m.286733 type:complete len:530 (-) Transcript_101699:89-1678(-)
MASAVFAAFAKWDTDNIGAIRREKLAEVIEGFGIALSPVDWDALLADCACTTDGFVDWRKFLDAVGVPQPAKTPLSGPEKEGTHRPAEDMRPDLFDSKRVDAFFEAATSKMMSELRAEVDVMLRCERDALRRRYGDAARQAQVSAMETCSGFVASLQSPNPHSSPLDGAAMAAEVCELRNSVSRLENSARPLGDCQVDLPFQSIIAEALHVIIEDSKALQQHAEGCLKRLTLTVAPEGMDGTQYPVQIRPVVDTVGDLMLRIRKEHSTKHSNLQLVQNNGMIVMRRPDVLYKYDLLSSISMFVDSDPVAEKVLQLSFDDPDRLGLDGVSGLSGEFLHPDAMEAISHDGRQGVYLKERCVLKLPVPVELNGDWTVSVWTLAPHLNERRSYRVLVDGEIPESMILLTLHQDTLGFYSRNGSRFVGGGDDEAHARRRPRSDGLPHPKRHLYRPSSLAEGWHHFAAVGAGGTASYYVNGECVGSVACPLTSGRLAYVGNTAGGTATESFGVMSDFQVFAAAASPEEVRILAGQ